MVESRQPPGGWGYLAPEKGNVLHTITDAPLGDSEERKENPTKFTWTNWTKGTCETEPPPPKQTAMISLPNSKKGALSLACSCISDAYTHELGPGLVPDTKNSLNFKYYNPLHTPVSQPYQNIVNISYKRLGKALPLLATGKSATPGLSLSCGTEQG